MADGELLRLLFFEVAVSGVSFLFETQMNVFPLLLAQQDLVKVIEELRVQVHRLVQVRDLD